MTAQLDDTLTWSLRLAPEHIRHLIHNAFSNLGQSDNKWTTVMGIVKVCMRTGLGFVLDLIPPYIVCDVTTVGGMNLVELSDC